jgi:hypothetical protein
MGSIPFSLNLDYTKQLTSSVVAPFTYNPSGANQGQGPTQENWTKKRTEQGMGALSDELISQNFDGNIVKNYPWTLSNIKNRNDIPKITLIEHKVDESSIKRQIQFYVGGAATTFQDLVNANSASVPSISVYDEIFPKNRTEFIYTFPYFTKNQFELNTAAWQQFDSIGQSVGQISSGIQSMVGAQSTIGKGAEILSKGFEAAASVGQLALQTQYPVVGIADRPRMFTSHGERSITIQFPLYNTVSLSNSRESAWSKNFKFLKTFMSQNLFNKRNFITGKPPKYYEVVVKNQYYSVASSVTNFTVENLGNMRLIDGHVVPDAYQVSITLVEMAMPSRNQFDYAFSNTVNSSTT